MNSPIVKTISHRIIQLTTLAFVVAMLVPLLPLPGISMVTGHPWKVELVWTVVALTAIAALSKNQLSLTIGEIYSSRRLFFVFLSLSLFTVWSGFSVFWADAKFSVGHHTALWFLFGITGLLVIMLRKSTGSVVTVYWALGTVSILLFLFCLFDLLSITDFTGAEGPFRIRYGKYAELQAMAAPFLASAVFLSKNRYKRVSAILLSGTAWTAVMISLSKGALLAGAAGFIVLFGGSLLLGSKRLRKTALAFATILIVFTAVFQFGIGRITNAPSTAQYISGTADDKRESTQFRTFVWQVGLTMAKNNAVIGVGADNFGISFNKARKEYVRNLPIRNQDAVAEDHLPERAHNELLQILSELGIIGLLLFLCIASGFAIPLFFQIRNRRRLSPFVLGCTAGMTAFVISSMVSSFSFRAAQNGIVFFILFGSCLYHLSKKQPTAKTLRSGPSNILFKSLFIISLTGAIALYAATGISNYYNMFAASERNDELAEKYYLNSLAFNPENAATYYLAGSRAYLENDPAKSIPRLEQAIHYGATATVLYFYLARSHERNGDLEAATKTMAETVKIYPQSVYARAHYSIFLERTHRKQEAEDQMSVAKKINKRQAESWRMVLETGLLESTNEIRNRKDLDLPNALRPENIIRTIFAEERLRDQAK